MYSAGDRGLWWANALPFRERPEGVAERAKWLGPVSHSGNRHSRSSTLGTLHVFTAPASYNWVVDRAKGIDLPDQ